MIEFDELKKQMILVNKFNDKRILIVTKVTKDQVDFLHLDIEPIEMTIYRITKDSADQDDWEYSYKSYRKALHSIMYNIVRTLFK